MLPSKGILQATWTQHEISCLTPCRHFRNALNIPEACRSNPLLRINIHVSLCLHINMQVKIKCIKEYSNVFSVQTQQVFNTKLPQIEKSAFE